MAREFTTVVTQIKEVAPQELVDALERSICFWAPESLWYNLSRYVNRYVEPSSSDPTAVAVYAILCDCSESEIKRRFEVDGL